MVDERHGSEPVESDPAAPRDISIDSNSDEQTQQGRRTDTVRSGAKWTVAAQLAVESSRLIVQLVLARLLVPGDFGIVTFGMATVVFLDIFSSLGTAPAIVQRPALSRRLLNAMFAGNLVLGAAMTGLFYAVSPLLANWAGRPDATGLLRALGLAMFISSFGIVHQGLIRRQLKFKRLAKANITQTATSGVVSVVLAFSGFGAWSLVWGQLAGRAVLAVLVWRAVEWRPGFSFAFGELRTIKEYSLNLTAFNISNYFFVNADRFLVGKELGAEALGLYGLGQQTLMAPVRSITRAVQQVLFPTFSRIQNDDAAIGRGYLRACGAIAAITFPAMAGLAVMAGPLITTLFNERWLDAIPVVTILAPVGLLHSLHFTVGVIYTSKGRADWQFRWGLASGVLTVVGYAVGLQWGITGVAGSYAVVVVLLTYPAFAIPFRLIGLKFPDLLRTVMPYTLASATMALLVFGLRTLLEQQGVHHALVLVAGVCLGIAIYGGWLFGTKPVAFDDLKGIVVKKKSAAESDIVADADSLADKELDR